MSQTKIEQLTPEQEALISVYREKWRAIALSTEPINQQEATKAVKAAYDAIGYAEPLVIFAEHPFVGLILLTLYRGSDTPLADRLQEQLGGELGEMYQFSKIEQELLQQIESQLSSELFEELETQLSEPIFQQLASIRLENRLQEQQESHLESIVEGELSEATQHLLKTLLGEELEDLLLTQRKYKADEDILYDSVMWQIDGISQLCIPIYLWAGNASLFDFCIKVLNCNYNHNTWAIYQSVIKNCGWIYPYEKVCIICQRPYTLNFDNQQLLHAEGEAAMQFSDNFSLYAYHGVSLPEKYGIVRPNNWQAQWLLSEENAELRRVLIQGIGYARICEELQAVELDKWQEYTLLKIDSDVDVEPIHLLKMSCPSTEYIHVLRVPPDITSVRVAIRWINWDIDPEDFAVQT